MSEKILVPELGESITEATVLKWLKNKGENINADEPVVELETDKVNLEISSPIDGKLSEINFKDGDTVKVGTVLGTISDDKGEAVKIDKKPSQIDQSNNVIKFEQEKKQEPEIFEEKNVAKDKKEEPLVLTEEPLVLTNEIVNKEEKSSNKTLSPAVRKIVEENNINLNLVQGSGKDGRILKGDLISMMGASPKPSER